MTDRKKNIALCQAMSHWTTHLAVVGILSVYTLAVLLVLSRTLVSLRRHSSCAELSLPLARMYARMLDRDSEPRRVVAGAGEFSDSVRVLVVAGGVVVSDSSPEGTEQHATLLETAVVGRAVDMLHHTPDGSTRLCRLAMAACERHDFKVVVQVR